MRPAGLPNFRILGTGKGGSTSLYYYLGQHPDVMFSTPKEPMFFEYEYERGLEYYWQTYFSNYRGERAVGEARISHLSLPYVRDRILASLPDTRFIVSLRDPVRRAYSQWWMRRSQGWESLSFEAAIADNLRQLESGMRFEGEEGARQWSAGFDPSSLSNKIRNYLDVGYYAQHLQGYFARFPRERFKVVFFEDLQRDPEAVVRSLWSFLGVDPDLPVKGLMRHNAAIPAYLAGPFRWAGRIGLRRLIPPRVGSELRHWVSKLGSPPRIGAEIENWLYQHYAPHNRALEKLLGCDLSRWSARD